jgi:ABC-type multidrug transport system ATPase subunit
MMATPRSILNDRDRISVQCDNISFAYGDRSIINSLSLYLYQGESTVLFGKSGTGKTTLLRCIAGYSEPSSGEIFVNSVMAPKYLADSSQYSDAAYQMSQLWQHINNHKSSQRWWDKLFRADRSNRGYMVFADCSNALLQLTVLENMSLVLAPICPNADLRIQTTKLLLELTGITEIAHQKPSALSSGQLRRLCLAQSLAVNPGLLLLDEPTNGLDFSTKSSFLLFVEHLKQVVGMTVLSVTHDLDTAIFLADRLLLFKDGRIVREIDVDWQHPRQISDLNQPDHVSLRRTLTDFLQ